VACSRCKGQSYVPAWKRWSAVIASEFLVPAILLSLFFGWRVASAVVVAVVAALIVGDIFLLKLKPSGKEPLGAYTIPLAGAFLFSTLVALLLIAIIVSGVVAR
jgi:hypothetical protein